MKRKKLKEKYTKNIYLPKKGSRQANKKDQMVNKLMKTCQHNLVIRKHKLKP